MMVIIIIILFITVAPKYLNQAGDPIVVGTVET